MRSKPPPFGVASVLPEHAAKNWPFPILLLDRANLLMFREALLVLSLVSLTSGAVVVDRVAIIVGRRVVKSSDIDRDLRCSQFMNGEPLNVSPAAKQEVAERLITQELIRQEIMNGDWSKPSDAAIQAFVAKIQKDRFGGSESAMTSALASYGLTSEQFRKYVRVAVDRASIHR